MSRKWGRHSKNRPEEGTTSVLDEHEHEWWLSDDEPTTVINRRWRRARPDGLHPRRRADDLPLDVATAPTPLPPVEDAEPFDPDALYHELDARPDMSEADGTEPWEVLGLTSAATWGDVVARQRELAKQHHPDLRAQVDAPDDDRMADINAAVTDLARIYRISGDR